MARSKRRNHPSRPRKRIHPLVLVLGICGVLLFLMVIGLVGLKATAQSWLRGEGFRDWLLAQLAPAMRSELEVSPFAWESSGVYIDRFHAQGHEDAAFSYLDLHGVRARTGGVRHGAYVVPEIAVNRLQLEFSDDRAPSPPRSVEPLPRPGGPSLPSWIRRFLPDRVEVEEIRLASIDIRVVTPTGEIPFALVGSSATVKPDFEDGLWEFDGRGGRLSLPHEESLRLEDLRLRWRGSDVFIDRCRVGVFERGHVVGRGEVDFSEDGEFDLSLEFSSIRAEEILKGEWSERVSGVLQGPVTLTGKPGSFRYEGELTLTEGAVRSVPMLSMIANYTRNDQFKHLSLSEARTRFSHEGDLVRLSGLVLQSDGLLRVEGEIDLRGEELDGHLQVGITPGTLSWIPGAERSVFVEERGGFLWAPVRLTGTTESPREDLSPRLLAAAGEAVLKDLPAELLEEVRRRLAPGEDLPSGAEDLLEQAKPLLDLLSPFLPRP